MADVYIVHKNEIFDKPIVFRKESDADAVMAVMDKTESVWLKRLCTIHESRAAFETDRAALIRERALSKLTDEEKQVLNIDGTR